MTTDHIGTYKGYLGNPNLKKSGVDVDWTPELVQEYLKCSQDPIYFCETYMKIINVDEGLVPFNMFDYQKEMVASMATNRYTIITTARQVGKSTVACGFLLWYIIFNSEKTVALLANKGDTAREILGKIQLAYEHLPKWLQQGVAEWNKGSFALENNSRVIAAATSGNNIRGYSINCLFIDEAAFIENWDEFFTSVFPTISSGKSTKVVLVSTPNGLNHFNKIWSDAIQQKNNYNPIQVMWNAVPGRDLAWYNDTLSAMGGDLDKFAQEHGCEFLGSSGTLIAGWKLQQLAHRDPVVSNEGKSMFVPPSSAKKYVLVADVARGKGLDYSAFQILDVTQMPYEQVFRYRSNTISPVDYAELVYRTAKNYNNAAVLVESNDIGEQVCDIIFNEFEYEGLMFTESGGGRAGKRIASGFSKNIEKGIRTTKAVKSIGCSIVKLLIEQDQLIIHDHETIKELSTFSKKLNSFQGEPGCHDDLVMGLVLFAWLTEQQYFKDLTDINTLMTLREKTDEEWESDFTPFGFVEDGHDDFHEPVITVSSDAFVTAMS